MEFKGYLYAGVTGLLWGLLGFYGINLNKYGYSGNEIAFTRMFFGFLAGFVYMLSDKKRRKALKVHPSNMKYILAIGIIPQALMNLFYYTSILRVGTVTANMLVCSGPIFTVILSAIFFKEKLTLEKQLALSISMLGSVLMVTQGKIIGLKLDGLGVGIGIAAGVCYGLYPILGKKAEEILNPLSITVYGFLTAAIFLSFFVDLKKIFLSYMDIKIIILIISFGIIPSLIPYLSFLKALTFIPPSKASIIGMLEVPTTAVIGFLILKEEFNGYKLVGLILIMLGISITRIDFSQLMLKIKGGKKFRKKYKEI
ncbi:MAG: DMT family transporter [Fusobacteriaceae bacterium]